MVETAYLNLAAYGDLTGLKRWFWIMSRTPPDSKFMALFSLVSGAGFLSRSTG